MAESHPESFEAERPVSAATRILLMLLFVVVFGGLVLGVLMLKTLVPTVQPGSEAASAWLDATMSIELPEDYVPIATLDWQMLYLIPMSGVWIEGDDGESVISIVRLDGRLARKASVRQRAVDALKDQAIGSGTVEKTETLKDVGGQKEVTSLVVREASGQYRVVNYHVQIDSPDGPLFLIEYKTPEKQFDIDAVRRLFQSIGPPTRSLVQ